MKRIILTSMLLFGVSMLLQAQTAITRPVTSNKALDKAEFRWKDTLYNFESIPQNVPVSYQFTFKNSGKSPLILTHVAPTCGCTVAEYTKEAIKPGQKGFIKVTFNAASLGAFNKSIAVHSNVSEQPFILGFKGEVITPQPVLINATQQ